MKIMLVDDQPAFARLYALWLHQAGHEVVTFSCPKEALAAISSDFDVVVSDIDMPHLNGVELGRAIRERFKGIPICFCSGSNPTERIVSQAREIGPVVAKDGRAELLLAAIAKLHPEDLAMGTGSHRPERPEPAQPTMSLRLKATLQYRTMAEAAAADTRINVQGLRLPSSKSRSIGTPAHVTIKIAEGQQELEMFGSVIRVNSIGAETTLHILVQRPSRTFKDFCTRLQTERANQGLPQPA